MLKDELGWIFRWMSMRGWILVNILDEYWFEETIVIRNCWWTVAL